MNKHDQSQFNFIMSLSKKEFDEWALSIPEDDVQYAIELIQTARLELIEQAQRLQEELLVETGYAEARTVLKKFML